ncbi:hypothetical protein BDV23DRAFT_30425 [Aspergillus alliaceus]|uniref:Retrovirus-related Pol polyprotein from transposon TNT 1-94-like beta-barrel domain-containing protein n=1 Tax=Petromyces alliaceus TaxID=209559 RepID=A0A5N7BSH3_PETAA|nr:uncharacterized protein BDW43DRAFT_256513 [Aspergillus alliaceus]KAB8227197.1 hypothetical protein BDW43DRAFT_256513 [Aspergillus alliaceus]KAE8384770.1 hypothetical protein BDV23DRAFT_30425 [Aspergillus alliaceus]
MTTTLRTHDDFLLDEEATTQPPKRNKVTHPAHRICYDWMVVSGNCHYARDRAVFTTYRSVDLRLKNNIFNPHDELHVAGVGTVHLTVCKSPRDPTPHVIVLQDVLHIPEAVCNGFNPLLFGSSMSCNADYWEGADRSGQPVWFSLPFAGHTRLVLAGDLKGESELIEGRYYTLSLYITPEEKGELAGSGNGNGVAF